jgi:hypothetical protein
MVGPTDVVARGAADAPQRAYRNFSGVSYGSTADNVLARPGLTELGS